jgi:hypothetical protein
MSRRDQPIEAEAVLASREYVVHGAEGSKRLRIAIGVPKKSPSGRYECQSEIGDDESRVVRPMSGVDAMEAIMLALMNIGTEMILFTKPTDRITWLDGQERGLSFPTLPEFTLRAIHQPKHPFE